MERLAEPLISPHHGDVELSVRGGRASAPPAHGAGSRGWLRHRWLRRGLGALSWWLLGRWLAVPLVLAVALVDAVIGALRLLWRDVLDLPWWHIKQRDPLGLVLQLAVQLPLGTLVAVIFQVVTGLFILPFLALIGAWTVVASVAGIFGLTTALPWALAALPVWGDRANAKAHALCSHHFTGPAHRGLGGGARSRAGGSGAAAPPPPRARHGGAQRLCDCLVAFKGGVLPIDRLALALVQRELGRGADVGAVDGTGRIALHRAARFAAQILFCSAGGRRDRGAGGGRGDGGP
jgi:hypothetical protein